MKRIVVLFLILCCTLIIATGSAEVAAMQTVDCDGFSFTAFGGSYLLPGSGGTQFTYYPQYSRGNTTLNINCVVTSSDGFNPVTATATTRNQLGSYMLTMLKDAANASGITFSSSSFSWSDPITTDGKTGIILTLNYTMSLGAYSMEMMQCQAMYVVGSKLYTFTATDESHYGISSADLALRQFLIFVDWD